MLRDVGGHGGLGRCIISSVAIELHTLRRRLLHRQVWVHVSRLALDILKIRGAVSIDSRRTTTR